MVVSSTAAGVDGGTRRGPRDERRGIVAHLSDFHLDGTPASRLRLETVARTLRASADDIDIVVLTGDLVEARETANLATEYAIITDLLTPIAPVAWCPGNSDERAHVRRCGPSDVRVGDVRVIGVDSTVDAAIEGCITHETIAGLRGTLASASDEERILIALHHPPIELGHPVIDGWRAFGETRALAALVAESPQVVGVLAGHTHLATFSMFGGKPLLVAPGVHSSGQPGIEYTHAQDRFLDEAAAPAFALHQVQASGRLVTNIVPVATQSQTCRVTSIPR